MRILVTGCNGLIGKSIYSYFLKKKLDVVGCYHNPTPFPAPTKYQIDLSSPTQSQNFLKKINPTIIIHTAAILPSSHDEENKDLSLNNRKIDDNIINFCNDNIKLIYFSSTSLYEKTKDGNKLKETSLLSIRGGYLKEKFKSEEKIKKRVKNFLIFRIPSPFGENIEKG